MESLRKTCISENRFGVGPPCRGCRGRPHGHCTQYNCSGECPQYAIRSSPNQRYESLRRSPAVLESQLRSFLSGSDPGSGHCTCCLKAALSTRTSRDTGNATRPDISSHTSSHAENATTPVDAASHDATSWSQQPPLPITCFAQQRTPGEGLTEPQQPQRVGDAATTLHTALEPRAAQAGP